ncbi:MAG: HlyC/CorC family transporter [Spirochaetales bacterium]|nr:HlyC/CorC family transporter [Spirochaetales bacterium]
MTIQIVYIGLLLVLSAIFSGTETAFISLTFIQEKDLQTGKGRTGKLAASLSKKPDILLSTILIGNNLVNIAASALTTATVIQYYGNYAVAYATGILTLAVLIFAEITPKQIAMIHNETICRIMAYPIRGLTWIMFPLIFLINGISSVITRVFSGEQKTVISQEGIMHAVNIAQTQGMVEDYETTFVQNVFRFDDIDVHTIMTHRTDVFSISGDLTLDAAMPKIIESGFARIPVFGDSPEHIIGILLTRDLLRHILKKEGSRKVSDIMKHPIFVPETRKAHQMFASFKANKLHMATVLDEYGGLSGVVTMEDVIEELFGELYDEHESGAEERILDMENGSFRIMGETSIQQLEDVFDLNVDHSKHIGTVAGLIIEELGIIPSVKQTVTTNIGVFTIRSMRGNRIESVIFTPARDSDEND